MKQNESTSRSVRPAILFDLDGTLIDSVYQHVLAWREALERAGIQLAVWRIHRRIGMSGGLLYAKLVGQVRPLPGSVELLAHLAAEKVKFAIATSGMLAGAKPSLEMLKVGKDVPVITRDQVQHAKPDPDLFLAAAERLGASIEDSIVVGDSVWDLLAAQRARALGVGLASGGYGREELERAGAYRTYDDPRDLMEHLDEIGVRTGRG